MFETTANNFFYRERQRVSVLCNQAKEDLVEEGRGTCDRGQRPVSRDRRALLSSRSSPPAPAARATAGWTCRQPT